METHENRPISQHEDIRGYRSIEESTDPIIDIPSLNDPAAYWRLLRLLSASQSRRAKHIFLAQWTQSEAFAARNREYAQVCLDTITEIRARLAIILDRTIAEVQAIEEYCAQPLVDVETVAELLPKLGRLQHRIKIIQSRLSCKSSN